MSPKIHMIPIQRIGIHRAVDPDDDLTALKKSIDGEGLARSVIVDKHLNLLDGLRRIRALQELGVEEVAAIVSETLETTAEAYIRTRKHGQLARELTYKRIWEFFSETQEQQRERTARQRRSTLKTADSLQARAYVTQILDVDSESTVATVALLYKAFTTKDDNEDPERREGLDSIREKLEANEITLYGARGLLVKLHKPDDVFTGNITTAGDQRNALTTALAQLSGTNKALTRLGELNQGINQHELIAYIKAFQAERRALQLTINRLRKRVSN